MNSTKYRLIDADVHERERRYRGIISKHMHRGLYVFPVGDYKMIAESMESHCDDAISQLIGHLLLLIDCDDEDYDRLASMGEKMASMSGILSD